MGGEVRHIERPVSFDPWEVVDDQVRTWKVVSDGSLINVPGHLRTEVDRRCGIHIHVDATPFDGRTLANLAKIIYKQEALILTPPRYQREPAKQRQQAGE